MKLIQTKDYLLLIDEEAEIKEGWAINPDGNLNYFGFDWRAMWTREQILDCKNVIAYYPLTKEAKELDLPLLPPFEKDIDMEELFYENCKNLYDSIEEQNIAKLCFYQGYKSAQSKQLELLKRAIQLASDAENIEEVTEEIIQSLSTQQSPKEFIPEYQKDWEETTKMFMESMGDNSEDFKYEETLKTITTSEGKEILVGTYKY